MAPTARATPGAHTPPVLPRASCPRGRGRVSSGRTGSRCRTSPKNVPIPVTSAAAEGGCATLLMLAPLLQAGGARGGPTTLSGCRSLASCQRGDRRGRSREKVCQRHVLRPCLQRRCVILLPWTQHCPPTCGHPKPASKCCCTSQEAPSSPSALCSTCDKDHFADLQVCGITRLSMPGAVACAMGNMGSLSSARPLPTRLR